MVDDVRGRAVPRLDVFKALGDNTRYAIYLELARSPRPLSTSEISEALSLHPNTIRPHLERMRDVGLVRGRGRCSRRGRPSAASLLRSGRGALARARTVGDADDG